MGQSIFTAVANSINHARVWCSDKHEDTCLSPPGWTERVDQPQASILCGVSGCAREECCAGPLEPSPTDLSNLSPASSTLHGSRSRSGNVFGRSRHIFENMFENIIGKGNGNGGGAALALSLVLSLLLAQGMLLLFAAVC
jgi:hypothetical protein